MLRDNIIRKNNVHIYMENYLDKCLHKNNACKPSSGGSITYCMKYSLFFFSTQGAVH